MRGFLSCLGVGGLLAAASLVHPAIVSAQPPCQNLPGGGPFDFVIAETPQFATANPEIFACLTPQIQPTFTFTLDLTEDPNSPTFSPIFPDSDSVFSGTGPAGFSNITLDSDTEPFGILGTSSLTQSEVPIACPSGFIADPPSEAPNTCDGAVISGIPFVDPLNPSQTHVGTLTVISDVGAAVPEPSTGLLLGAALPALLRIRRRSRLVSA